MILKRRAGPSQLPIGLRGDWTKSRAPTGNTRRLALPSAKVWDQRPLATARRSPYRPYIANVREIRKPQTYMKLPHCLARWADLPRSPKVSGERRGLASQVHQNLGVFPPRLTTMVERTVHRPVRGEFLCRHLCYTAIHCQNPGVRRCRHQACPSQDENFGKNPAGDASRPASRAFRPVLCGRP